MIGVVIGLAGVLGVEASARASQVLMVGAEGGLSNLEAIDVTYSGWGSQPESVLAGTLTGSLNGGSSFALYCVDLADVVLISGNDGTSSFSVNPLPISALTGGNGAGVGYLYDEFAATVAGEADGPSKNIDGAALQVAIWKTEYDNGGSLTSGNFQMADSSDPNSIQHLVFAGATQFLSTYDGSQSGDATWYPAVEHPIVYSYSTNQNTIGPGTDSTQDIAAPEPSSIVMASLGALGMVAYAWRTGGIRSAPLT
jgi:hypothetical protein